ncbi:MAG TPA: iron chelate uptake ABC transporter family permease subunit [Dehalococcoidia bacterium]|nr:iron chelate uptake ABC transporter family permease subunit [Dehalococcoidia bacterium]
MTVSEAASVISDRIKTIRPHWRGRIYAIIGLCIVVIVVVAIATTIGSVKIPILTTLRILVSQLPFIDFSPDWTGNTETILLNIRLPRIVLAGIIGAALSVAGATYQGLFRNPLADPYLIGAAQGAALGAVIGFLLPIEFSMMGFGLIPLLAFSGAIISVTVVYILARVGKTVPVTTLILAGVALGALWGAIYSYLVIISGDKIHPIIFWVMGSFSMTDWSEVGIVLPYIAAGIIVILLYSRSLNVMQLDEEQAKQLGINVERTKLILLAASTLITAAAVSFVGTIGFVGIIIPHAVRLIWGPDHRFLLPLSILTGAIFLILADLIARTVMAPTEIPIGIITAICGVPFFLYLLRRRKGIIYF